MYEHTGTLGKGVSFGDTILMTVGINDLNVNADGFYSVFHSAEVNSTINVVLTETKSAGMPYMDPRGLTRLCVSNVRSSVVFMFADNRGVYLEYWSGEQYRKNCFTLHIQWKELGIEDPTENHYVNFLAHLKKGVMGRYFGFILSKGSKARKAILKVMERISFSLYEEYKICNNYSIRTNQLGSWDLYKDGKSVRSNIVLEQITLGMVMPKLH